MTRSDKRVQVSPFEEVIADFAAGKMVILLDDADRENEGDLTVATEKITTEQIAFMMQKARGQICVTIPQDLAKKLNLPLQVDNNTSQFQTPFALSVGMPHITGITADARAEIMHRLIAEDSSAEDFVTPGYVFPLIVHTDGVLGRLGQTEGSHDLAKIAGLYPSGVICEILNPDGTMAKGDQINYFARVNDLKITTIEEIINYRKTHTI